MCYDARMAIPEPTPDPDQPTEAAFQALEGERDELLAATERDSEHLDAAEATIDRQASSLAGQRASIAKLTGERNASEDRADRLRLIMSQRTLELREKEMLLAWVLESSVDGVLVFRSIPIPDSEVVDFECVLANPAAERLYELVGLAGKRLLELHPDIHEAGLWDEYLKVMKTGEPFEGEYRYQREGVARWFRVLVIRVANGLAITFSDITQRKKMEADILRQLAELQQADRMKSEFLGVLSHELRTPINGMMGYLSILQDEIAGPLAPKQQEFLAKAAASSERLLVLVENLLDLSRVQAGRFTVDPQPVAVGPVVERVLGEVAEAAQRRVIVNEVPADLPPVLADEMRLAQVLAILVDNAIKFSQETGTITIGAALEGDMVRFHVRDTGVGIAEQDLAKLFRVFSQVDMSATRHAGGAGLGLALAKHLIEAHGGQIGVDSQEGQGSTFWFTLPTVGKLAP